MHVSIDAPVLPPLPAAVEVAAYRIVQEALAVVSHHAGGAALPGAAGAAGGVLEIEVVDDGQGLREGYQAGVGLLSMRERATELGGTCTGRGAARRRDARGGPAAPARGGCT